MSFFIIGDRRAENRSTCARPTAISSARYYYVWTCVRVCVSMSRFFLAFKYILLYAYFYGCHDWNAFGRFRDLIKNIVNIKESQIFFFRMYIKSRKRDLAVLQTYGNKIKFIWLITLVIQVHFGTHFGLDCDVLSYLLMQSYKYIVH